MRTTGIAELIPRLRTALDALFTLDISALSEVELLDALAAIHPLLCQAQAVQTTLIRAAHRRALWPAPGAELTLSIVAPHPEIGREGERDDGCGTSDR